MLCQLPQKHRASVGYPAKCPCSTLRFVGAAAKAYQEHKSFAPGRPSYEAACTALVLWEARPRGESWPKACPTALYRASPIQRPAELRAGSAYRLIHRVYQPLEIDRLAQVQRKASALGILYVA